MSISERYRELVEDVRRCSDKVEGTDAEPGPEERLVEQAYQMLNELKERVGDIPRIRLEGQLTPVLLKAHNSLDAARLLLEGQERGELATEVWGLEQTIYRLLNDL